MLFPSPNPSFFRILGGSESLQIATMTLQEGQESGPFGNDHPDSEQYLVVISGRVRAEIKEEVSELGPGESALVPRGADHRFVGISSEPAVTVNVYSPPAYDEDDSED